MGYYSDVAIALPKLDFERMQKDIRRKLKSQDERTYTRLLLSEAEQSETVSDGKDYVILKWDSVKWYNDFPEVKYILDFINKLKDYDYVCIGEEYEDVEVIQNTGNYLVDVVRSIEIAA